MSGMSFPFGRTVWGLRARMVEDPYAGGQVAGDWDDPVVIALPGSFIAQTSTTMLGSATREQATESKSLFCDGALDVRKGDRILDGTFTPPLPALSTSIPPGTTFVGIVYTIDGIPPAADTNPFTGWTPPREIPLTRSVG